MASSADSGDVVDNRYHGLPLATKLRISNPSEARPIHLRQIEIFGVDGVNYALPANGGSASQSSTHKRSDGTPCGADKLIDGDTNGGNNHTAHTQGGSSVEVRLARPTRIARVVVWNHTTNKRPYYHASRGEGHKLKLLSSKPGWIYGTTDVELFRHILSKENPADRQFFGQSGVEIDSGRKKIFVFNQIETPFASRDSPTILAPAPAPSHRAPPSMPAPVDNPPIDTERVSWNEAVRVSWNDHALAGVRYVNCNWPTKSAVHVDIPAGSAGLAYISGTVHAKDQGWGNTGHSYVALALRSSAGEYLAHKRLVTCRHASAATEFHLGPDEPLVRAAAGGQAVGGCQLDVVAVAAPYRGFECIIDKGHLHLMREGPPPRPAPPVSAAPQAVVEAVRNSTGPLEQQLPGGAQDLALLGRARQSSDYNSRMQAHMALRGSRTSSLGFQSTGEYAHTSGADASPWWQVELRAAAEVEKVAVFGRPGFGRRLQNVRIELLGPSGAALLVHDFANGDKREAFEVRLERRVGPVRTLRLSKLPPLQSGDDRTFNLNAVQCFGWEGTSDWEPSGSASADGSGRGSRSGTAGPTPAPRSVRPPSPPLPPALPPLVAAVDPASAAAPEAPALDRQLSHSHLPPEFFCPITGQVMRDPVVLTTGHSFEREAIATWFARGKRTCPCTNVTLESTALIPNITLRKSIEAAKEAAPAGIADQQAAGPWPGSAPPGAPPSTAFLAPVPHQPPPPRI